MQDLIWTEITQNLKYIIIEKKKKQSETSKEIYGKSDEMNLINHLVSREAQTPPNLDWNITNEGDDRTLAISTFQGLTRRISKQDAQIFFLLRDAFLIIRRMECESWNSR